MRRQITIAALLVALSASGALAQQKADPSIFTVKKLTPQIYAIFSKAAGDTALSNITVFVSDEGVLMVDDAFYLMRRDGQTVNIADGVIEQIRRITDKPIRYVINTHDHNDHSGGNPVFGRTATVIVHENARKRLVASHDTQLARMPAQIAKLEEELAAAKTAGNRERQAELAEQIAGQKMTLDIQRMPDFARSLPVVTYGTELQLHFGGEEIRIYHFGPAHTDGDSMVYFTRNNVVSWGDTFQLNSHPAINPAGGGSTPGWISFLESGLQKVKPDAIMVPGHGGTTRVSDVGTVADVRAMQKYLTDVRAAIGREVQAGKTREQTVASVSEMFPQYKGFRPNEARFRGGIGAMYDEFKAAGAAPRQ